MSIKKNFFAPLSSGLGATRRAAMLLLVMMLTTVTTWADPVTLTSSTSTQTWKNNTYVANGEVNIEGRITVTGTVTLVLTDGCTLRAPNGIEVKVGNSLTIEGGTNGTGTLIIAKNEYSKAGIGGGSGTHTWDPIKYGNITINGGIVNVKGGAQSAGIGGGCNSELTGNGTITINGGIVNATGGNKAAGIGGGNCSLNSGAKGGCGAIVINGGQVTATGGDDAPGIGPGKGAAEITSGSLVLGWTNTTDFIKVTGGNSAYGFSNRLESISFAKDKKFNISGGGEATTIEDIKNKVSLTLVPKGSEQYQLSAATISGISASYDLTDSFLDIPFSVSDAKGNTLTLGTHYTATLGTTSQESPTIHITEGGKYTLTITGKGSYAGSKSVDFEVISIGFKKDANGVDYINMPKTGIYYDANIPSGVSSFNVYDDGGAKAQYSNNYDGGLVLTAPDHYVLQLTGTVTAEVWGGNLCDYLMVYDGVYDGVSTSAQKIGDKYGSDESGENIGTLISSGKQMTLTFHSDPSGQRDGLNLKVTLKRDIRSCDIANIDDQTYTGSAIEPNVTVTDGETTLTLGTDYEVAYSNNISAGTGTATVTISGKGNYSGEKAATFTIAPKLVTNDGITVTIPSQVWTGSELTPIITVKDGETKLIKNTDYTVTAPSGTIQDAGDYTYTISGKGNYSGEKAATFTIIPKAVTNDGITIAAIADQTYTGSAIEPDVTVTDGETTLTLGTDYTIGYSANVNVGTATATITGKGNYSGEKAATFTIIPKAVTNDGITIAAIADQTYTGSAIEPEVTVNDGETTLSLGTDYEVAYSNNISAGTATVTISGKGNYSGEKAATFTIAPKLVTNDGITVTIPSQTWTGSELTPVITVKDGETELIKNTDYTVTAPSGTIQDAGDYTYTISGKGNYSGEKAATFTIAPKLVTNDGITVTIPSQTWTGSELTPVIIVKDGETVLTENTDYTVTAPSGTIQDAGDYTYTISGKGNYSGEKAATFTIMQPKDIATCDITLPNQTLSASSTKPELGERSYSYINYKFDEAKDPYYGVSVGESVKDGETTLTLGTDYTFGNVYYSDGNGHIINPESPTSPNQVGDDCLVEIIGIGNYAGTAYAPFKIAAPDAGGTWGDNGELTWAFHDGTLTISPTENVQAPVAMKETNAGDYPWFSSANYINTITIGEGVSTVADDAFNRATEMNVYGNVKTVSLPSTLTTIGDNAFAYCTGATITIPESVTTLGANPFNQVGCVVVSKPLEDGNDNSDLISKIRFANSTTFTYKRSFTANVASTVCLPFAHTPSSEGTYYTFMAIDKTTSPWTVTMTSNTAASLTANTPYMFMPAATGEVSFNGTASSFDPTSTYSSDVVNDPVVTGGKWNLIGTYESRLWDNSNNTGEIGSVYGFAAQSYNPGSYTVSPGDFVKAMAGASIAPFRAYLKYTAPVSNAPRRGAAEEALPSRMTVRLVNADGDVTAIGTIDTKTGEIRFDSEAWYTLDGHRLNGKPAQKGVYINNGKKIIVK